MSKDTRKELVEGIKKKIIYGSTIVKAKNGKPTLVVKKKDFKTLAETIVDSQIVPCEWCGETGKSFYCKTPCRDCKGKGYIPAHEVVKLKGINEKNNNDNYFPFYL